MGWHAAPCEPKEIEMSPTGWTDALHLAHEPMDRVHREFINLLAAAEGADDTDLVSAWGAVVDHTAVHFANEDRWMRETHFADAADHQLQHRVVLNLLRNGLAMARDGQLDAVREMALELDAWFAKHTQAMDAALALHMRRQPEPVFNALDGAQGSPTR
jgi:hemerythrin-like metal-binding protein